MAEKKNVHFYFADYCSAVTVFEHVSEVHQAMQLVSVMNLQSCLAFAFPHPASAFPHPAM